MKRLSERKTRENIEGASCWSMVRVREKVVSGGKWTWKISSSIRKGGWCCEVVKLKLWWWW
jgi:hypothetical protein